MRFRLQRAPAQEQALLEHCAHARFVWNLAVEQHGHWRSGWSSAPGYLEQCRQLTEARREFAWLAAGSQTVQQQALRDFAQAMRNFFAGTHRRPTWRKAGRHVIRVEDLKIRAMVRSARGTAAAPGRNVRAKTRLNRSIHASGWGRLVTRLEDKAPGRVEKINPAYCHACGHCAAENRESQTVFRSRACGHTDHADVNAAKNIAVGRTVTARGGQASARPVNREPHLVPSSV